MSKAFYNCIKAAFRVGVLASIVNLLWFMAAKVMLYIDYSSVKWYFVLVATMLPILLSGVVYYLLYSATRYHRILFVIGCIVVVVLTLIGGPLSPVLPDGSPSTKDFQVLTIPMHCIAGFMAAFILPVWNHLNETPNQTTNAEVPGA